jgi:hypothetical protein
MGAKVQTTGRGIRWLAVCEVSGEPVSGARFPVIREFTGNSSRFGRILASLNLFNPVYSKGYEATSLNS